MSISNEEVQELRKMIEERCGVVVSEKITRVEMISKTGERTYFHTEDRFSPKQAEQPKEEYILKIFDDEERALPFQSMDSLIKSFATYQRLNKYKVSAVVNGQVVQEYTPIKE